MRLGVIDIGSNTVHTTVLDAARGIRPVPQASDSVTVKLMRFLTDDGDINEEGVQTITAAVTSAAKVAKQNGADHLLVIATSALREAGNGGEVLAQLEQIVGMPIEVLSAVDEARLTFLAVRRWYGWGAGRLLVLDIGGGSLEIAAGNDELPDTALSVPLGAGRMTRQFLWTNDPPKQSEVAALREYVRHTLLGAIGSRGSTGLTGDHVVATSKTFRSLARLAGMPREVLGSDQRWRMRLAQLEDWVPRLAKLSSADRTALPGIGARRSLQIAAGAVVAEETMRALRIDEVEICPWALREGAILQYLEQSA